jgi:NAD-dependent deacetylase
MNAAPPRPDRAPHFEQFMKNFLEVAMTGRVVVLTGAGVSAASGLPTFRGPEGWWTVGSRVHRPEELATAAFFAGHPEVVWEWYLFRWTCARQAEPNAAHRALADLAGVLGERLTLVTQNVDGLHRRAGSPPERTFEIHGNLDVMRCAASCRSGLVALPESLRPWRNGRRLQPRERESLLCASCGDWMRPHVLWFDEFYEEALFRSDSSLACMESADLFLVIGSSGATTLPLLMLQRARARDVRVMVVDPQRSPFSDAAGPAATLCAPATTVLPLLVGTLAAASGGR